MLKPYIAKCTYCKQKDERKKEEARAASSTPLKRKLSTDEATDDNTEVKSKKAQPFTNEAAPVSTAQASDATVVTFAKNSPSPRKFRKRKLVNYCEPSERFTEIIEAPEKKMKSTLMSPGTEQNITGERTLLQQQHQYTFILAPFQPHFDHYWRM